MVLPEYKSKYLSSDEIYKVLHNISRGDDVKIQCITIAQVFTASPPRIMNWTHLGTGVLFLSLKDDVAMLGLYNMLGRLIVWEEELYKEIEVKKYDQKMLTFSGKRSVFLLNFAFPEECKGLEDMISQWKIFGVEYEKFYEVLNDYEAMTGPEYYGLSNFEASSHLKQRESTENEGKNITRCPISNDINNTRTVLAIGGPDNTTFQHQLSAKFVGKNIQIEEKDNFLQLYPKARALNSEHKQDNHHLSSEPFHRSESALNTPVNEAGVGTRLKLSHQASESNIFNQADQLDYNETGPAKKFGLMEELNTLFTKKQQASSSLTKEPEIRNNSINASGIAGIREETIPLILHKKPDHLRPKPRLSPKPNRDIATRITAESVGSLPQLNHSGNSIANPRNQLFEEIQSAQSNLRSAAPQTKQRFGNYQ